jgi:hypothetical protein
MVMKFDNEFKRLFFATILAENKRNIPWTPSRFPQSLLNAEKEKQRLEQIKISDLLFDKFVETFITDNNIEKFLENNSHLFNSTVFAILQQEYNKLKN